MFKIFKEKINFQYNKAIKQDNAPYAYNEQAQDWPPGL